MVLKISNLSKNFLGLSALSNMNITLQENEILGILGPNGAGKTTLFNVISGFFSPTKGSIKLFGKETAGLRPSRIVKLGLARTFQIARPFQNLTVIENVMVGLSFGVKRIRNLNTAKHEANQVLQFVNLEHKSTVLGKCLNTQEKMRLEIARALATHPKVLLLDECLAGLNPTEVMNAMNLINKIRMERNIAIMMIEHVMDALIQLSDRVVLLDHGKKIAEGPTDEVMQNPVTLRAYFGEEVAL